MRPADRVEVDLCRNRMEEQHQQARDDDLMTTRFLPEDVLAQILCLLPPRDLAVSRCVFAEWKGAVDGRRLLRADLLPLSVGGIFINFQYGHYYSEFFRPRSGNASGNLDPDHLHPYCDRLGMQAMDHCNGLVLLGGCVANPATGWFAPLVPWPWPSMMSCNYAAHVVFEPAVSSHYSVFLVNHDPLYDKNAVGELQAATQEWPPSHYPFHVFSSAAGRWEERPFLRQGDAVGTIADVRLGTRLRCQDSFSAAYWKQALYVHCENNFFFRISLSRDEYRVIKPPPGISIRSKGLVFGKSEKGPYFAESRYADRCFKVWILDESNHNHQWVLKHCNKHLGVMLPRCYLDNKVCGPWILEDINYIDYCRLWDEDNNTTKALEAVAKQRSDCSLLFDEDGGFTLDSTSSHAEDMSNDGSSFCYIDDLWLFGFHPYKEIVFLSSQRKHTAVAYDLNSSKFQYLGNTRPTNFDLPPVEIDKTFVYTPCKLEAYGSTPSLAAD